VGWQPPGRQDLRPALVPHQQHHAGQPRRAERGWRGRAGRLASAAGRSPAGARCGRLRLLHRAGRQRAAGSAGRVAAGLASSTTSGSSSSSATIASTASAWCPPRC
jgi:hypothetical protein